MGECVRRRFLIALAENADDCIMVVVLAGNFVAVVAAVEDVVADAADRGSCFAWHEGREYGHSTKPASEKDEGPLLLRTGTAPLCAMKPNCFSQLETNGLSP